MRQNNISGPSQEEMLSEKHLIGRDQRSLKCFVKSNHRKSTIELTAIFLKVFFSLSGFIDSKAEESDRKQGERGGVTRSKGTLAGSQTQVRCRASAHGTPIMPTELK